MTSYESSLEMAFKKILNARTNLSSSTEGRANSLQSSACSFGARLRSRTPIVKGESENQASPAQFICTACQDKHGYYEYADGYRNFDTCCYCAPVDPVRDILADDREPHDL